MNRWLLASAASMSLLAPGAVLAQDSSGASQSGQMTQDITCAQIVDLDEDRLERAVYFLAGYRAAQREAGMDGTGSAAAGGASTSTTASSDTAASGAGTSTAAETSDSASAATDTTTSDTASASSGTSGSTDAADTTASADASNTTSTDTTTTAGTTGAASAGSGASGSTSGSGIPGMMEIPVEQVVIACRASPESRASDVVDQQGGGTAAQ